MTIHGITHVHIYKFIAIEHSRAKETGMDFIHLAVPQVQQTLGSVFLGRGKKDREIGGTRMSTYTLFSKTTEM